MSETPRIRRNSGPAVNRRAGIFKFAVFVVVAIAVALGLFAARSARSRHRATLRVLSSARVGALPSDSSESESASEVPQRSLFPYSVIPGGVENSAELKNAIDHDPIVARHYADFDVAKARVVRLDQDRMEYVSYRLGNSIYWTNRKLKLLKGEYLITDGTHDARTRCGNRLSENEAAPLSPKQPVLEAMEAEQPNLASPSNATPFATPWVPETPALSPGGESETGTPGGPGPGTPGFGPIPPIFFPYAGGTPGGGPSRSSTPPSTPGSPTGPGSPPSGPVTPPVSIPEPSTMLLLAVGLASLLFVSLRKRRAA